MMEAESTKDDGKPMVGQASSDIPALKPYWGKPAVRNFRGGDGNVGIIRSPVRAIALPDYEKGLAIYSASSLALLPRGTQRSVDRGSPGHGTMGVAGHLRLATKALVPQRHKPLLQIRIRRFQVLRSHSS
jgi:hypothetical protein